MKHENGRVKRGLYVCESTGIKINADLNAARNIAKRAGYEVPMKHENGRESREDYTYANQLE